MNIIELLSFQFIQNAYLAGSFIAILSAILGLILVLRKLSLIGDGLAHVSFGAIALALFLGIYPTYLAIPIAILASFLISQLSQRGKIHGDAAIGIVSTTGIALGIIFASLAQGFNIDLFSYLFGNILAISSTEVYLAIGLSLLIIGAITWFYHDLFSTTFDREYAAVSGIKTARIDFVLMSLTAITIVLAIKLVGIMLISALLILPALSSLQLAKGFLEAIIIASLIAVLTVLIGITLSFYANLPSGATIVIINLGFFLASLLLSKFKRHY
ncbi:MAG: metal ABC transporter permease [Patescibacteria group bacterium]|jgi:zinc transport system permease protein